MNTLDFINAKLPPGGKVFSRSLSNLVFRSLNPYEIFQSEIRNACIESIELKDKEEFWRLWTLNFQRSILDYYQYPEKSFRSIAQQVSISNLRCLETLRTEGGLVLTYHFHHQNTLCCVLGLLGVTVWAVANRPESSQLYPYIGHWASKLNRLSQYHFCGGQYLYTDDLKSIARQVPQIFQNRSALVCLVDVHQPSPRSPVLQLYKRSIEPPVGVIESARRAKIPIHLVALMPDRSTIMRPSSQINYELWIEELTNFKDTASILRVYFDRLEQLLSRSPYLWQGWQWLGGLPRNNV